MSLAKLVAACGIVAVALGACGIQQKPLAGTARVDRSAGNHAYVTDPRTKHLACLRSDHLPFRLYDTRAGNLPAIQVGSAPSGPTIVFYPSPGDAETEQLQGLEQGAELIGQALLYTNSASSGVLDDVEKCTAIGVSD